MSLFDRTFLISTGITAVICGALYYYLNAKIRDLEFALVKQNQVLSSFIANVQQEFRSMAKANRLGVDVGAYEALVGGSPSNELASAEALAAVADLEHQKIVISDSEGDSEDSDDESVSDGESATDNESASDNESVSDNEIVSDDNKLVICELSQNDTPNINDMKIIDMSSLGITTLDVYDPVVVSNEIYTPEMLSDSESENESDSENENERDDFHHVTKLPEEEEDKKVNVIRLDNLISTIEDLTVYEPLTATVSEPLTATVSEPLTASKYDDLKVDELRKLVLEKGLVQKDEVKKLKKNELLAVLKKHF